MIKLEDVYKMVVAMVPLYVALVFGYGSVRWWRVFTPQQCDAVNRLVSFFTLPLFTFHFTATVNPFDMNYRFVAADVISKLVIVLVLVVWKKCSRNGSYRWFITSFSLSTLTSPLVVGVPLARAMYGEIGVDLVVQGSVLQSTVWLTVLLLVFEIRRGHADLHSGDQTVAEESSKVSEATDQSVRDLEENSGADNIVKPAIWSLIRVVWLKLAMNPNSYACSVGIIWAFISHRWHIQMPEVVEGSILIMSKAGTGTAMFSMGMFVALQEKIVACGTSLTIFGMLLRFIAGPAAMAIGSMAVGLHGDVLRIAIIQAAIPQSITSFIFAKEYGLHPAVLSTAVIFGLIVSLPIWIAYYAVLEFLH